MMKEGGPLIVAGKLSSAVCVLSDHFGRLDVRFLFFSFDFCLAIRRVGLPVDVCV